MNTEKGLPVAIDDERFVLGSILLDGQLIEDVRGVLDVEDFSLDKHRKIYKRIIELNDQGQTIDRVTVHGSLKDHGESESCDGFSYLLFLDEGLPQIPNIDAYVRRVKEKAVLRAAIFACQHVINRCMAAEDGAEEILASAEATVQKLAENSAQRPVAWRNPGEVMIGFPGGIGAFLEPQKHAAGIATPWPALTDSTGGFREGELWVVAGRPSMGKSLVAMQSAVTAAKEFAEQGNGDGVAVFSLEMSAESLIYRMLSAESRVDAQRFRMGFLNYEERQKINKAVGALQDLPLKIDDTRARTIPAIVSALRKLTPQMRPRLIIVDHLQLMKAAGRSESLRVGLSEINHAMKHIASDFKATVMLLSQLNRDCEKDNRRPQLSDLKETGSTEEDADIVTFVHRWERYQKFRGREDLRALAELILAKQRNGATGICNLVFLEGQQKFETACGRETLEFGGGDA